MILFNTIRRHRLYAVMGLILAWSLLPMVNFTQTAWEALDSFQAKSLVAKFAIGLEHPSHDYCVHHPEGCPKDCHCPKIPFRTSPIHTHAIEKGSLSETNLVDCTAGQVISQFHASLDFLPDMHLALPLLPSRGMSLGQEPSSSPLDPFLLPLQKIPIV